MVGVPSDFQVYPVSFSIIPIDLGNPFEVSKELAAKPPTRTSGHAPQAEHGHLEITRCPLSSCLSLDVSTVRV